MQNQTLLGLSLRLWLVLLAMMVGRFALMLGTGPIHDEAYYWSWSQRLDFGYYDQPFLTGWVLAPFVAVLGDHAWVLRAVATGLTFATSVFLAQAARSLVRHSQVPITGAAWPSAWRQVETGFLILVVTNPVLWTVGLFYTHDTVMLCFLSLGLWLGVVALGQTLPVISSADRRRRPVKRSWPWWLAAGLALGLAFSAKVSAMLWIAAMGLAVLLHPGGWRHLRRPGPWLAALVVTGFVGLFVIWNAAHDWVTFRHVSREHLAVPDEMQPITSIENAGRVALTALALVLFSGISAVFWSLRHARQWASSAGLFALAVFVIVPIALFLALSWFREIYLNWLIPSALGIVVIGCLFWPQTGRRSQQWFLIGGTPSLVLTLALLVPIGFREPRFMPANARDMLGWEGSIESLVAYRDLAYPDHEIVGNYYQLAAQAAFHQGRVLPSVGLDPRPHQFTLYPWPPQTDSQPESKTNAASDGDWPPMLVLSQSLEQGLEALEPIYCDVTPISPWPVNHREGRIAEPYLLAISTPRKRPDCP